MGKEEGGRFPIGRSIKRDTRPLDGYSDGDGVCLRETPLEGRGGERPWGILEGEEGNRVGLR